MWMRRYFSYIDRIVLVMLVVVGSWFVHTWIDQAPSFVPVPLTDRNLVRGIWGVEPEGAWTNGYAQIGVNRHAWAPWSIVQFRWKQPPTGPVDATIQSGNTVVTAAPTLAWRTVHLLLPQPQQRTDMVLRSTTQRVEGDRRDLGVFLAAIQIQRFGQPSALHLLRVLDYALPLLAAAVWLWRSRWLGIAVWIGLFTLYGTMLHQELQVGMANPALLLDDTGRYVVSVAMLVWAWLDRSHQLLPPQTTGRRFGLDVMRAVAVLCVIVAHFTPLMVAEWRTVRDVFRWFVYLGAIGVDIFFALSGYLIGGILWRNLHRLNQPQVVQRFWMRRWLRTLPAAYVSALVVWLVAAPQNIRDYLSSIVFLGTINPYYVTTELGFWWSLGAEEVFYFFFPLVISLLMAVMRKERAWVGGLLIFGVTSMVIRAILQRILPEEVVGNIEFAIYARLDSMIWGVLLAWIRQVRPQWFDGLAQYGFAPGMIVFWLGYMLLLEQGRWYGVAIFAGHILTTTGAALLIPAMEHVRTLGWRSLDRMISWVALVSYSAYLYHIMMVNRLERSFGAAQDYWTMGLMAIGYLAMTFVASWLSYRFVEEPVLRWRDTHYPEHTSPSR
jgi:peptidoglycan/LPS O-acetylase OafA/YrhL